MSKVINFVGYDCNLVQNKFQANNSVCLSLVAADTKANLDNDTFPGEPIARASVFVEGIPVSENQTLIKDYSENKGILKVLVEEGLVEETGIVYNIGQSDETLAHLVNIVPQ
jgi:hypothetical protein